MTKIIIIYSTTDGHTRKICTRLQQVIENQNHHVSLVSIQDTSSIDLNLFDKIILGASIRYGKHHPEVYDFITANAHILSNKPNAFFSVNLVARKPGKNHPETNPYLKRFLSQIAWQPEKLAVFAGKLDYQKYSFWDRHIIRLIMWITRGPTDLKTKLEYTNWSEVEEFALAISEM